jgi:uncharacterized membrane protein YhaH (DUF805 family)
VTGQGLIVKPFRCRVRKIAFIKNVQTVIKGLPMSFVESVRTCLKKYATFSGGATRPEYWWFVLFSALGGLVLALTRVSALRVLWFLVLLIPELAVAVRRHHDAGRSGWWIFASIIWPWEVVLLCYPSKLTGNKYVEDRSVQLSVTEADLTSSGSQCPSCGKLRLPGQNYCMGCGAHFPDNQ